MSKLQRIKKQNKDNAAEINETLDISQKNISNVGNEEMCESSNTAVVTSMEMETPVPDVIPVYSIAMVQNCPDSQLSEDFIQSIRQFLASEPHLAENIRLAEFQCLTSRSVRNNIRIHFFFLFY